MTDRDKEKIKLRATYFNGVAIGFSVAGVLVPGLAYSSDPNANWPALLIFSAGGILISYFVHLVASHQLNSLP
ncbi:hypothetical protein [Sinorhizobium meliloti]|uniref:hypothetical protein n=1 Tax=Rhizobium meliloti TaxID=382 RepID=UPI000FE00FCB|nr:hypothetical protein [Sinorhizobium meliloti]MDX0469934.1 hypothetical protein [Sinorhizobium medicae]MDX1177074.1 hypothetical protein [Sinorhizobium medicae]MDX1250264.1 hypothetical protein [Sinorhizobium medicae]RVL63497.1 hypothetical protein CN141_06385 [Sinorhizobium meliloti]